jgi:hypothetical protein
MPKRCGVEWADAGLDKIALRGGAFSFSGTMFAGEKDQTAKDSFPTQNGKPTEPQPQRHDRAIALA